MSAAAVLVALSAGGPSPTLRPTPKRQLPLPPFDPNDSGGIVHTTLPPEQVIPPHFADPLFMRADFNGVTLPGDYEPTDPSAIQAHGGVTITSGRWAGLFIPYLPGANTTPATMVMTPMLVLYPQDVQRAVLTEHAERALDDFIWDCVPWNAAPMSPAAALAWCQTLKAWGFRPVLWRGDPNWTDPVDEMLTTLVEAGAISFYVHGEEADRKVPAEVFEAGLDKVNAYIAGRIPIGVHFTCDGDRKMGYPIGFPRDTFINDWSRYDGRVHLCLQLDSTASAGLQGASMYYARQHVNAGIGDAARGPGAPNSRVIAFETMATEQLYGRCSEAYGCLRTLELLCGTRLDPRVRPVSGSGNGGPRDQSGNPL